jgi:uracil-DNA glycosylase family 4
MIALQAEIVACQRCPRLIEYCAEVARVKRRAYREWTYWGRPVPSFGDPGARMLIVGLAPAAHGANRTGRVFTGDRSGDFLYRALYQTGFASQPESRDAGDGLELRDAWITCTNHCAPPGNKPRPEEIRNCRPWLEREIGLLTGLRVVVALGRIAFEGYLRAIGRRPGEFAFGHNVAHRVEPAGPLLIGSYHPSQQNTSTGRLTESMLRDVFEAARTELNGDCG